MIKGQIIIDIAGHELTPEDREVINHPAVAGIILFTRNYHDKAQLKALTHSIAKIRQPLIIAVDQEGGRVQRFRDEFTRLPPMAKLGELYEQDPEKARKELVKMTHVLVSELYEVGVNLSLVPVLDLNHGVSQIIGDRSFSAKPEVVVELASVMIETLQSLGMPATGKHFPGHGAVVADSHLELPRDDRDWESIQNSDLMPFTALSTRLDAVMPAHIVYSQVDTEPAGFSRHWLETILRAKLGFKGAVMSDDLTMAGAAIAGSYAERAHMALEAGCDLLPVCNNRTGSIEVLEFMETYKNLTISSNSINRAREFIEKCKGKV